MPSEKILTQKQKVVAELKANDIRASYDLRDDRMNAKIRDAQTLKIAYTLVVGEREEESGSVSVRYFGKKEMKNGVPLKDFIAEVNEKVEKRESL